MPVTTPARTLPFRRRLAEIAERLDPAGGIPRTALEDLSLAVCRRRRLPLPEVNAAVLEYAVDFLWPRERLIAETDGRETHATPAAFFEDRIRDARLAAAAFHVLRFTHWQVARVGRATAATVRSLLAQRALLPFPAA